MSKEQDSCSTKTFDVLEYSGQRDLDPDQVDCFLTYSNETESDIGDDEHDRVLCQICKCSFVGSNSRHELLEHINSIHSFSIFEKADTCCVCSSVFYTRKAFENHRNNCQKKFQTSVLIPNKISDEIVAQKEETENTINNTSCDSKDGVQLTTETTADYERLEEVTDSKAEKSVRKEVPRNCLKCYVCSKAFQGTKEIISHVVTYHKNELTDEAFDDLAYRCKKCAVTFPNLFLLRGHFFKKHAASVIYRCMVCHVTLRTKKSLRIHYNSSHASKSKELHSCHECGKKLANLKAIKAHVRLKHGSNNKKQGFRCRLCNEKFDTKENRKLHYQQKHLGESPFICTDCGKGFSSKSGLYGHRQLHKTDQPSTCPYCEKIFNRRDSYHEHILIHVGPRHRCPHCPKEFVQRSNLVRHIRIHTGHKPYACTFCDKRFSDKGACNSHIRVHTKEEQCACPYCGQTFTKKQKLKYHIRKHTGEGLISCEICSKTFTNAFALKEHRSIHDRQTQTMCVECGKAFNSAKYLQRHVALVHQELQDSATSLHCPMCGKIFYHQTRLKTHLATHLGKKHLQCLVCEKRYSSAKAIRNHLKLIHELTPDQQEFKNFFRSTFENTQISLNFLQLAEDLNSSIVSSKNEIVTFLLKKEDNVVFENKTTIDETMENKNETRQLINKFHEIQSVSCSVNDEDAVLRNPVIDTELVQGINLKDSKNLTESPGSEDVEASAKNGCNRDGIKLNHENMNAAAITDIQKKLSNLDKVLLTNQVIISKNIKSEIEDHIDVDQKRKDIVADETVEVESKSNFNAGKDIGRRRKQLRIPKKYVSSINSSEKFNDNKLKNFTTPQRERVEAIARSLKASSNLKEIFD